MRRFRCAPMSHTHLSFQCKKLSFCNAQTGNKIQDELKGSGGGGGVLACIIHDMLNGTFLFFSICLHCLMMENAAFVPRKVTMHSSPRQSLTGRLDRILFSLLKVENSSHGANPLWWCHLSVNCVHGVKCSREFLCSSFLHDEAYVKTKNTKLSDVTTDGTTHSNNNFQEAKEDQSTVQ